MAKSSVVLAAAGVEVGVVTWRSVTAKNSPNVVAGLPIPAVYLDVILIFGALSFLADISDGAGTVAGLAAWGYVLATFLTSGTGPITALTKAAGKSGASTPTTTAGSAAGTA